jgi:hypothetical protein
MRRRQPTSSRQKDSKVAYTMVAVAVIGDGVRRNVGSGALTRIGMKI